MYESFTCDIVHIRLHTFVCQHFNWLDVISNKMVEHALIMQIIMLHYSNQTIGNIQMIIQLDKF